MHTITPFSARQTLRHNTDHTKFMPETNAYLMRTYPYLCLMHTNDHVYLHHTKHSKTRKPCIPTTITTITHPRTYIVPMRTYLNDVPRTLSNTLSQPCTPLEHHLDPMARGPTPSTFLTRMRLIRGGALNGGKAGTRDHGGARGGKPRESPGWRAAEEPATVCDGGARHGGSTGNLGTR